MQNDARDIQLSHIDTGQGLPLVFVHGFPLSRDTWQHQIELFGGSYRVIAPNLRGFGSSGGAVSPVAIPMTQHAADLHALLERLATGPVVLIGHSMGGYVALAFARRFPDLLAGLVLVSTRSGQDAPDAAAGRRLTAEKVRGEGVQPLIDAMAPKLVAPAAQNPKLLHEVRDLMAQASPAGVIGCLLGMADRDDATSFLSRIKVPTLVVTGTDDTLIPPAESQRMAEAIPGAQLSLIPQAGHLVAFERPEAFNRVLQEWLHGAGLS